MSHSHGLYDNLYPESKSDRIWSQELCFRLFLCFIFISWIRLYSY